MRIVVESGTHLLNHGDNAMLVVAMRHIQHLWPDARVQVVTEAPGRLAALLPGVEPLTTGDRGTWERHLLTWIRRHCPWTPSGRSLQAFERKIQSRVLPVARLLTYGPTSN